jgi:ABC-2 type transport system ATP-binding protein
MKVIKINNLVKTFGKFTALNGVTMLVEHGEIHAFLGPNGAGKTTTIRCLLGLIKATSGETKIFGKDAWRDAVELHRRIAFVPGDVNLWDNLTGGEVIDLFLSMRGENIDNNKREMFIKRFELDTSKKCRTYSKGNRQKVALVAAFASNADLYVFDEPTSGLDPLMEKVFQDCTQELKAEGKTILLSSHILSEVEKLADTISIIREGKIVVSGSMQELIAQAKDKSLEELFLSEYETKKN